MKTTGKNFAFTVITFAMIGFIADLPKSDLHVHLSRKAGETLSQYFKRAAEQSSRMGVVFGLAEEIATPNMRTNDSILAEYINEAKKYPVYLGLQVNQPGWTKMYSKKTIEALDYICEDALRFPDKTGKVVLLWLRGVTFSDPQDFMDRYIAYHLKVFSEPINIWVNPTFLPEGLANMYDQLWTEDRMKTLITESVKNNIAVEINSRYKIPGKKFIKLAKASGAHFTFGSNQHDTGIGDIKWSVDIANECGLSRDDFFIPRRVIK
jgi:hypothetical protein